MKKIEFSFTIPPHYTRTVLEPRGHVFQQALKDLTQDKIFQLLNIRHGGPIRLYAFYNIGAQPAGFNTLDYTTIIENGKAKTIPTNYSPKRYNNTSEYDSNLRDTAQLAFDFKHHFETTAEFSPRKIVAIAITTGYPTDIYTEKKIGSVIFTPGITTSDRSGHGFGNIIVYNPHTQLMDSHPLGWVEVYNCERAPHNYHELNTPNDCASLNSMNDFLIDFKNYPRNTAYLRAYLKSKTK